MDIKFQKNNPGDLGLGIMYAPCPDGSGVIILIMFLAWSVIIDIE